MNPLSLRPHGMLRPVARQVSAVALLMALASAVLAGAAPSTSLAVDKKHKPATAAQLLKQVEGSQPGEARDAAVDALLELGAPAWPEVKAALPAVAAIAGGEDAVVDLLLGFGPTAWDEIVARGPKLSDKAALRLVRQVLRFPADDRHVALLEGLVARDDEPLLLLVLPELVQRNRPTAMPRLVQLVDDKRASVRSYAIDTLVARRYEPAIAVLVRRLGQERLAASPENLNFRVKLITAVAHLGANTDAPVASLIEALETPDQRDAALDGLQIVGAPAVKAAVYLLQTAERSRIDTALIVLSHLRIQAAPQLVPLLTSSKDETTRGLIVDVLAHLAVPEVRAEVLRLVRERKFPNLEQGLLLALTMYDEEVRKLLVELAADKDPAVRKVAVQQFWRLADPESWPVLRRIAANDPDVGLRLLALRAMVGLGDPKAVDYLRKLTTVNDLQERLEVLQLIGRIDDEGGVSTLARQLGDPNDEVFRAALSSLRRLTFHAGPRREGEWLAWQAAVQQAKPEPIDEVAPTMHRFAVDGREMGWLEAGDPSDKTIVVLAGAPYRDATHLMPHVWHLAQHYHVVVLQRGVSALTAATLSEAYLAQELGRLQTALNKKQIALLADPTAGHFALRYANEHPKDVAAVILHGGPWPTQAALRKLPDQLAAAMPSPWQEDARWALEQTGLINPDLQLRVLGRTHFAVSVANPASARRLKAPSLFYDGFSLQARDRLVADAGSWDASKATVPTLLLQGNQAPWSTTSAETVGALPATTRKQVKWVKLDACGAMPLVEKADEAVTAVREFLK